MIRYCLLAALCFGLVACEKNACDGEADGSIPEYGCRAFTRCEGGVGVNVDCWPQVFNPENMQCDDIENTPPPCGLTKDCSERADGRYADLAQDCGSYFTCYNGLYYGHNPCSPGLVFDEENQICNWPFNVAPPCGTMELTLF